MVSRLLRKSHPEWVRGLKQKMNEQTIERERVASRVGAWIETTDSLLQPICQRESHPEWVRGLKQERKELSNLKGMSHPEWVRGLKPIHSGYKPLSGSRIPSGCVD